jgi:hypothetical protein
LTFATKNARCAGPSCPPIDSIDEVRAALEVAYAVIDAEFTSQPIGQEAAIVLWGIIVKLRPLRQSLNELHGAA